MLLLEEWSETTHKVVKSERIFSHDLHHYCVDFLTVSRLHEFAEDESNLLAFIEDLNWVKVTLRTHHNKLYELRVVKRVDDHAGEFHLASHLFDLQFLEGALKNDLTFSSSSILAFGPVALKSWHVQAFVFEFFLRIGLICSFQYIQMGPKHST